MLDKRAYVYLALAEPHIGAAMERLAGLVAAVAERDIASWPAERPLELHSPCSG
ncbi:MAG: hypothetical protein JO240_13585, partial [Solirubrobacterales bacterium]|nr:hypothetical protein [Solirubrobacterales bacterium]